MKDAATLLCYLGQGWHEGTIEAFGLRHVFLGTASLPIYLKSCHVAHTPCMNGIGVVMHLLLAKHSTLLKIHRSLLPQKPAGIAL